MMKELKNTNSFGVVHFQPHKTSNGEVVLDIECGEKTAILYKEKLCLGSKGKCILHRERWLTPNEFQFISGRQSAKDWKRSIRHGGKSLKVLITKGYLTVHANGCECTSGAPHREKDANKGKKNKVVTFAINKEIERDELRFTDLDEEIISRVSQRKEEPRVGNEFESPSSDSRDDFIQRSQDSKCLNAFKSNRLSLDSIIDRLRTSKGIDDGEVKKDNVKEPVTLTAESLHPHRENDKTSLPSPQMQIQNKRPAILSNEQSLKRRRSQEEHLSRHLSLSPEMNRETKLFSKYSDVTLTEAEKDALAYKAELIAYQSHLREALTRPSKRSRVNKRAVNTKSSHKPTWQFRGKCDVVTKHGYTFQREQVVVPSMFYDNNVPHINGHIKTADNPHVAMAGAVPEFHHIEHLEAANRPVDLSKSNSSDQPLDLSKRGSPIPSPSLPETEHSVKQTGSECKDVALAPLDLTTFKKYHAHIDDYGRNKRHCTHSSNSSRIITAANI